MKVEVVGLKQFRSALKKAEGASVRDLTKAMKAAGKPVEEGAEQHTPHRSGRLGSGYRTRARAATAFVTNLRPYAGGAEFGQHGKWTGFARYGAAGNRFAGRAADERADEVAEKLYEGLREPLTSYGWLKD